MSKPSILLTVGSTDLQFAVLPVNDQGAHVIREMRLILPDASPPSGIVSLDNLGTSKDEVQTPPFSLGRRFSYNRRYVWDMYNVNARYGQVTLGPLAQTPTDDPDAATYKISPAGGFFHSRGLSKLFMLGSGAANDDEPVHFWDGTNAWTNATLNADFAANLPNIVGVADVSVAGVKYLAAVFNAVTALGADNSLVVWSTNGTTWTRTATAGQAQTITAGTFSLDRVWAVRGFAAPDGSANSYVCLYSSTTNAVSYDAVDLCLLTVDAWASALTTPISDSDAAPRGFVVFDGSDGQPDLWISTNRGLFQINLATGTTSTKQYNYLKPTGTYTGTLMTTQNYIYFLDGDRVCRFKWLTHEMPTATNLTPGAFEIQTARVGEAFTTAETASDLNISAEGVPADALGDFTAIWADPDSSIINIAKAGLAATTKARIYQFDEATGIWTCDYQHGTANLAIMGGYTSTIDATVRRHISVETTAGGNQTPLFFDSPNANPFIDTTYVFASSGVLELSDFNGYAGIFQKGFYKTALVSRGLTGVAATNERIDIQHSLDGASYGTAQTVGVSPRSEVWTDGATTAVGSGANFLQTKLTLKRTSGGSTTSPKLLEIHTLYDIVGLNGDGNPFRTFTFKISLNPVDYIAGGDVNDPKDARAALETIAKNAPLVQLAFSADFPNGVAIGSALKVKMLTYREEYKIGSVQDQVDLPQDGSGWAMVVFKEVA